MKSMFVEISVGRRWLKI